MANANIKLGYKTAAWFTANASRVLGAGQIVYLEQTGTYKLGDGVTQLSALSFLGGGGTVDVNTIGTAINGATSATPNDTDLVISVDTSVAKKNTWTQIKAFLKTYFDTVYTTTSAVASQITTALSGYATQAYVTSQGYITNVITALGYTPENSANKTSTVTGNETSTTLYTTVKGVVDWVTSLFVKKGTLTTNYIPKATASDTIGDSQVFDNGTDVGIGTSSPTAKLDVNGGINVSANNLITVQGTGGYLEISSPLSDKPRLQSYGLALGLNPLGNNIYTGGYLGLGVGNNPQCPLDIKSTLNTSVTNAVSIRNVDDTQLISIKNNGDINLPLLTASQIVETDASKNLVSVAKGTAYNKNFGTTAGTVLEGNAITQTITNGVTNKAPSEDAVFDALALKRSATKEMLLSVCYSAPINPADGQTYYFGEHGASIMTTGQGFNKFQFNENFTITRIIIEVKLTANSTSESVSFYLRAGGTTDNTITTSMDMSTIGTNGSKVFVYTPTPFAVTSGTDYETKILCPTWVTNPGISGVVVKYYGY